LRRRRWLLLAVALVSVLSPVLVVATSPASASPNWSDWFDQALAAAENAGAIGSNVQSTDLTAVDRSSLGLPDGTAVTVDQRTVLVDDGTTQLLLGMTVLGGQQLIVDLIDPSTGHAVTLVLAPGSSDGSTDVQMRHTAHRATAPTGASPSVAGGCYASPDAPFVVGSIYGPLVKGIGVVSCPFGNESLSAMASLYERTASGSAHVGNGGSASVFGTYLAVDAYYGCAASTGHQFQTAQLWSVNGALQPGAASGWPTLGCR
jgi:hypothetical protein